MRGRDRFQKLSGPLKVLELIVGALPRRSQRAAIRFRTSSDGVAARAVRYAAIRAVARECGELVDIKSNCVILGASNLSLGSRISIHPFCYIDATGGIEIGSDVSIAHSSSILSTEHVFESLELPIRDQGLIERKTIIGDDVWIGAGARILAGVSVGTGAVVAAGAVVTADVAAHTVVGGVPARVLKSRQP